MFCWGKASHHELCIEGPDHFDTLVVKPTLSKWSESNHIQSVAAGESHALYLTDNGKLYSCGNNETGQLGRTTQDSVGKHPEALEKFKGQDIICCVSAIACGMQHSMAIDACGQTFSWGSDSMGQLGSNLGGHSQEKPTIINALATKNVIQIACGSYHSVALTNNGDLFSWGANSFGQCGLGTMTNKEKTPLQISSLLGVPIAMIASGSNHTFALSKSGAVYGWGKNSHGQLGLQDRENRCHPTQLKTLRNLKVCHIACGEEFTAFLTLDGGVLTCGAGDSGQTGHGVTRDELVPRQVVELMGSPVTQVSCGRAHMLTRTDARLLACGQGAFGQLGCPNQYWALVPTPVALPGGLAHDSSPFSRDIASSPMRVFAGGDHSFLISKAAESVPWHFRAPYHNRQILTLTLPKLAACEELKEDDVVNEDLMAYLKTVFGSLACMNGSFLQPSNQHYGCRTKVPGVDLKEAEKAFTSISRIENRSVKELMLSQLSSRLLKAVVPSPPDAEALRVFLVAPLYHEMRNPRRQALLQGSFAEAFNKLVAAPQKIVSLWWQSQSSEYFEMLVDIFKSVVVYELMQPDVRANKKIIFTHSLIQILNTLSTLNKINFTNPKKPKIPAECFYIEDLSNYINIETDYIAWFERSEDQKYMCDYPFLFDVPSKSLLLHVDQRLQMQRAVSCASDQFLHLTVSRHNIAGDTMTQIYKQDSDQLKKPLKVKFVDEEAVDVGGVKKEFFFLLIKEMFDPAYGMFTQSDETNMLWFSNNPFEDDVMFCLIGAIYGLAIYNSIIIYVPFPLVLYKKLLGESVMLDDISDLYPTLAYSLKSLLDYPVEDVEEVFSLCFAVNTKVFDQIQVHPLKENGENIAVTHLNKEEYVELYLDFLLNKSVKNQFEAFKRGFQMVCCSRVIELFRSHELMSVVIGNEQYDWELFRDHCEYDGYTTADQQIRWFWEVINDLSIQDKKKFLLFLTGSDRVPVKGMTDLKIRIQSEEDDRYFPIAHTCFNLLTLPRYKTKERLQYHLLLAIQQTQGFSLH